MQQQQQWQQASDPTPQRSPLATLEPCRHVCKPFPVYSVHGNARKTTGNVGRPHPKGTTLLLAGRILHGRLQFLVGRNQRKSTSGAKPERSKGLGVSVPLAWFEAFFCTGMGGIGRGFLSRSHLLPGGTPPPGPHVFLFTLCGPEPACPEWFQAGLLSAFFEKGIKSYHPQCGRMPPQAARKGRGGRRCLQGSRYFKGSGFLDGGALVELRQTVFKTMNQGRRGGKLSAFAKHRKRSTTNALSTGAAAACGGWRRVPSAECLALQSGPDGPHLETRGPF